MAINKLRAQRPPEKKSYPGIKLSTECVYLNLLERLNDASSEFCSFPDRVGLPVRTIAVHRELLHAKLHVPWSGAPRIPAALICAR